MTPRKYKTDNDFAVRGITKFGNDGLIAARESLGLSAPKAARAIGISYQSYNKYEYLRAYPSPKTRQKICDYYKGRGITLDEGLVFPPELKAVKMDKPYTTVKEVPKGLLLSASYAKGQLQSAELEAEQRIEAEQLTERVEQALSTLTPREREVLRRRFGIGDYEPETLEQVGRATGTGREGSRQIEARALRKLQHPSRSRTLRDLY